MLVIKNLTKKYYNKNNSVTVVNNLCLNIEKNDIVGFLGSNGAGKTTTVKMICGLVTPTSGKIFFDGENIQNNRKLVEKNIGVMLEGARNLYHFLTVEENISYFAYLNRLKIKDSKKLFEELLEVFDMKDKRNTTVNKLSRGMQQKVAIMVAIIKKPKLLILDEPTLGLDIASKIKMQDFLFELSKAEESALIVCTHEIQLAEKVCNKIAIFHKGNLIAFEDISNFKFSKKTNNYKMVVMKSAELINFLENNKVPFSNDKEIVEFEYGNLYEIMKIIKYDDILKLENISDNLESIIRGLE